MGHGKRQSIHPYFRTGNFPTPVFVYDYSLLLQQLATLRLLCSRITHRYTMAYSYKTNPLLARYIYQEDCVMQVTSWPHFEEIKRLLGVHGLKGCFFNTASLTEDVARKLAASSIQVVVDSLVQIELMNKVGKEAGRVAQILIRVDTGVKARGTPFGTSGAVLGLPLHQAGKLILSLSKYQWIEFRGIHNHAGSQNIDLACWKANVRALETFIMAFPQNVPLHTLNLGGGYPIPYVSTRSLSVHGIFLKALKPSLQRILKHYPDVHLVIEPGRFLVGPAGFLVTTITNLQPSSKKVYGAVVNASLFATFNDRFLSKMTFQPTIFTERRGKMRYFIRGSSPASIDYFGTYDRLPELHIGDTLVFGMMGAYASSMGSSFSGVTRPREYLLKDTKLTRLV